MGPKSDIHTRHMINSPPSLNPCIFSPSPPLPQPTQRKKQQITKQQQKSRTTTLANYTTLHPVSTCEQTSKNTPTPHTRLLPSPGGSSHYTQHRCPSLSIKQRDIPLPCHQESTPPASAEMKRGPRTRIVVDKSLMTTCRDGPAVSLKGSPTVSPVIAAL